MPTWHLYAAHVGRRRIPANHGSGGKFEARAQSSRSVAVVSSPAVELGCLSRLLLYSTEQYIDRERGRWDVFWIDAPFWIRPTNSELIPPCGFPLLQGLDGQYCTTIILQANYDTEPYCTVRVLGAAVCVGKERRVLVGPW